MDNVKIFRMQNGEDIIAFFEYDEDFVLMGSPMAVFFKRAAGKSIMMMSPWIPVEIVEDDIISIHVSQILTVMTPKEHMIDYYKSIVFDLEPDEDESLRDATPTDEDLDSIEDEELDDFFESVDKDKVTKKPTIH